MHGQQNVKKKKLNKVLFSLKGTIQQQENNLQKF